MMVTGVSAARVVARWVLPTVAALIFLIFAGAQWDRLWSWTPWSTEARLNRAVTDTARARAEGASRAAESRAKTDQLREVEAVNTHIHDLRDLTAPAITQARRAPDATLDLDPDRAHRLRDHDSRLCDLAGATCLPLDGAPPANPDHGAAAVPDRPASG